MILTFCGHFPFVRGDKTVTQISTAYLLVGRIALDRKVLYCLLKYWKPQDVLP